MLEFYYKFYRKSFKKKAAMLANEIHSILNSEGISLSESDAAQIDMNYRPLLGEKLAKRLNDLYYSIRINNGAEHYLLHRYLPELRHLPTTELCFADCFSGAGGLGRGLVNSGLSPIFVNDLYIPALETYYFNHDLPVECFSNDDIKVISENLDAYVPFIRNVKCLTGGPPCQGFSVANRRNFTTDEKTKEKRFIEDERNVLYKHFVRLIGKISPDFFIIENVRGMSKVQKQIEQDINKETNQEYHFVPLLVNARDFDIPQSRERYFLIGGKNFMFIEQVRKNILSQKKKESKFTLSDALYGLPAISRNPHKLRPDFESEQNGFAILKSDVPQNEFLKQINKGRKQKYLFNHKSRYNNDNDIAIFTALPEGQNSLHESIRHLNRYTNRDDIFKDKYFKLRKDQVSKTITSHMRHDCHMYIHPDQPRGLSPREAARLQTFPDDYMFRGSTNDWYWQIGNAVPVRLAELIGKEIIKFYK